MNKQLASLLGAALVVGATSTSFAAANPFSDVAPDHWAYDAVSQLATEGVINGYTDSTFKGDATMTRYEMAQIVAKSMARQDALSAQQKALLDKLANEFSDELANLGVRVQNLEQKVDNLTWTGFGRYEYTKVTTEHNEDYQDDRQKMHLRLNLRADVNANWKVYSRIYAMTNFSTDRASEFTVDRAWAQGDYDNLSIKFGKIEAFDNVTHGMIFDDTFSGIDVSFGKNLRVDLRAGRIDADDLYATVNERSYTDVDGVSRTVSLDETANYLNLALRYVGSKFDAGVGYTRLSGLENRAWGAGLGYSDIDKMNIWNVGLGYRPTDKWYIFGDYAWTSDVMFRDLDNRLDANKKNYRLAVSYGNFEIADPGSFDVTLMYRKRDANGLAFKGDLDAIDTQDQGWALNTNIALLKNVGLELEYFMGKDYITTDKKNIFWGQLQFVF